MDWKNHIESTIGVCGGRPRVRSTRLTVEFLLGLKAEGWTETQILENYSQLGADDLRAVFAFAQALIEEEKYLILPHVA
jgi:uncharacterized protein (DUF433 family)